MNIFTRKPEKQIASLLFKLEQLDAHPDSHASKSHPLRRLEGKTSSFHKTQSHPNEDVLFLLDSKRSCLFPSKSYGTTTTTKLLAQRRFGSTLHSVNSSTDYISRVLLHSKNGENSKRDALIWSTNLSANLLLTRKHLPINSDVERESVPTDSVGVTGRFYTRKRIIID